MAYGIKHRETDQYFGGFDAQQNIVWVENEEKARSFSSREIARAQACLFIAMQITVARNPVRISPTDN
jgi:hypothetical protein